MCRYMYGVRYSKCNYKVTHLMEKSVGFIVSMQQRNPQVGDVWKIPDYKPLILNLATCKFLTVVSHN